MKFHRIVATLAVAVVVAGVSPTYARAGESWNDYSIVGLPAFISLPTPFIVGVDGPNPVCSMTYRHDTTETTLTAPPWSFVASPRRQQEGQIRITECGQEGYESYLYVDARFPFEVNPSVLPYTGDVSTRASGRESVLHVTNYMDVAAAAVVTAPDGRVVARERISPRLTADGVDADPTLVSLPAKSIRSASHLTITITGDNGIAMTRQILIARGWAPYYGIPQFVAPCSTVSWSYATKGQPRADNSMKKDVRASLARLASITGLRFVEVSPATGQSDPAEWGSSRRVGGTRVIQYRWANLGTHGPSGMGGTDGTVTFNNRDFWPRNENAGFALLRGYFPGRGWLIIHETMHVLGFDHIEDKTQVMNPVGHVAKFGKGDLAGLHALYPKGGCATS